MTSYDKLDWHHDGAVAAGQPPEHGFTHIGFYLAWLVRHDLHDPTKLPAAHVAAVKRGEMSGSDLADDVDTKLVPGVMSTEGRAFSDARYEAYVDLYGQAFADEPDYGVTDDPANYARIAPELDRLYAAWVAEGRPRPRSGAREDEPAGPAAMTDGPRADLSRDEIERSVAEFVVSLGGVVMRPPEQSPHEAPDLERLIPTDLTSPPMDVESLSAARWASSLLNRALKRLGIAPRDAVVVTAIGGFGPAVLTVTLYGVPGVAADRLASEFEFVISLPTKGTWRERDVAGRSVRWASGDEFTVAFWARDGLVVHVAGDAAVVESAIARLP